jgi:hypothetical protein
LLLSASVYRLSILFPEKGTSSKLIWLNNLTFNDEIPYQHMYNDLQKYMEDPDPTPFSQFGHDIQIWMGDSCRLDGPANECIEFLDAGYEEYTAGGDGWAPLRWGGNNIVVAGERVRERAGEMIYRDVTLADLRYGLSWLTRENGCFESEEKNPYILRAPQNWSKAVKISSSLDVLELGKKKYRDVLVRADHVVFENPDGLSEAARCLGFPLLATTYEPSCEWTSEKDREKHYNQPKNEEVFCLIMNGDLRTKLDREQNSKEAKWEKVVSTTLVARQDKKDLTAHQVEALICFTQEALLYQDGHLSTKEKKNAIEEYMASIKFNTFFEELKKQKIVAGDESWKNEVLPPRSSVNKRYDLSDREKVIEAIISAGVV